MYFGGILMSAISSYSDLFQARLMSLHSCKNIRLSSKCYLSILPGSARHWSSESDSFHPEVEGRNIKNVKKDQKIKIRSEKM